ncbi:uncharacterized protein PHACADRAFT_255948 [Phanerochaete carnosa HHB-10118-sp]|uniref:Uncharacterized protein n=1 Tax=Phanerochaete carnosa (strain HHB-10118-sp) TaxID=650164 RepID=K5W8T6_PHACS|nr:uncharacterized protein PHACADRAFT_255948 [Phanerochaete carnosa HHB-10118-sp]EKM55369.1 hypothetical protein PHACADRAFT_255948 [Phanerochaete carnosa HHB-10118-sp]
MEKQHLEHRESLQTFKAEMGALNAALQAYISRPTSPPSAPPAPPVVPDMQYIADTIRPMVLESIRNDVRPLLEDLTIEVQQMITRQNTQVAQSLMNKLQLTLKTVEVIYNWMNRTAAAQVQLAAPPPAAASPLVSQNAIATNGHGSNGLSSPAVGTSIVDATNHRGASPVVPVTTAFIR